MMPADVALETNLDYESIFEAGSMLGSGAVIAINEQTCIVRPDRAPGRLLQARVVRQVHPLPRGHRLDVQDPAAHRGAARDAMEDLDLLLDICDNIAGKSFCPLGDAAVGPVQSSIERFRDEYEFHIREKRCMVGE